MGPRREEGLGSDSMIRGRRTVNIPPPPPPTPAVGRRRLEEEEEEEDQREENTSNCIAYCNHRRYLIAPTTFILYIPIFAP